MAPNQSCPVCNGPISPDDHECKRCGFRLAGKTEMFAPVGEATTLPDAPAPAESPQRFSLYVSKGPQASENFFLDSNKISLGRDPQCDIFLNDMTVSREHAIISIEGDKVMVHDNGSLNGTWIDGNVIDEAELRVGSVLQIGTFKMVLQEHKLA